MSAKKKGGKAGLLILAFLVVAIGAYVFWSPYGTLREMREGLKTGQTERMDEDIDYSSVREGLKRDFRAVAVNEIEEDPSIKNRLLGMLGLVVGAPIADTAVDYMVSPSGLKRLVNGSIPILSSRNEPSDLEPYENESGTQARPRVLSSEGHYLDFNHFVFTVKNVSGSATGLTFTRRGLMSWQLTHVKLMPSRQ